MQPRFYCEQPITSHNAELRDSELQHMTKVMRLGVGDRVTLFDSSGQEFSAVIESPKEIANNGWWRSWLSLV